VRLHVLPSPGSRYEAARFIASALLLSHSIRVNAIAAVRVGGTWVVAAGGRVRHLRPDADTAEGWLRAVLRGSRLGAELRDDPPEPVGRRILLLPGSPRGLARLPGEPVTICYGSCPYVDFEEVEGPAWPSWSLAEAANIIVDRVSVGLRPCP